MSRSVNAGLETGQSAGASIRVGAMGAALVIAVGLAGCSADLGRFDFPSAGFNGDSARPAPLPSEGVRRGAGLGGREDTYAPPAQGPIDGAPPREPQIRMSGLPEASSPAEQPRGAPRAPAPGQRPASGGRQVPTAAGPLPTPPATPAAQPPAAAQAPAASGEVVEVQQGDTVYGIAKKHRISISELMKLNNLEKPVIRPGQKLVLPAGRRPVATRTAAQPAAASSPVNRFGAAATVVDVDALPREVIDRDP